MPKSGLIEFGRVVREFYALEALNVLVSRDREQFLPSHERFARDVREYARRFDAAFARACYDYIHIASVGEARHASQMCALKIPGFENGQQRTDAGRRGAKYTPASIRKTCAQIFDAKWNSDSYGGKAWGQGIAAIDLLEISGPHLFCDHCVDLQHNSGCLFNKSDYRIFYVQSHGFLVSYLDWKRDSLNPKIFQELVLTCIWNAGDLNDETVTLCQRACNLGFVEYREMNRWGDDHWAHWTPSYLDIRDITDYVPVEFGTLEMPAPVGRDEYVEIDESDLIELESENGETESEWESENDSSEDDEPESESDDEESEEEDSDETQECECPECKPQNYQVVELSAIIGGKQSGSNDVAEPEPEPEPEFAIQCELTPARG